MELCHAGDAPYFLSPLRRNLSEATVYATTLKALASLGLTFPPDRIRYTAQPVLFRHSPRPLSLAESTTRMWRILSWQRAVSVAS